MTMTMTAPTKQSAAAAATDLAARIYTDLICRNVAVSETAVQVKANPESLARTSFQLAEVFLRIDSELRGDGPRNQGFDMHDVDLTAWNAAKT
jgi:hypothetical protein